MKITTENVSTLEKATEYFLEQYDKTEDINEKQIYGNLYVWLVTAKDTEYARKKLEGLNTPKLVFGLDLMHQSCPNCGAKTMLYNQYGVSNVRCGMCGQLLKWYEDEDDED